MRTRYGITAAAVAAAMLALPATASAGQPSEPGCTAERGVSTCVSTSTVTGTLGPLTTGGSVNDGSPQAGICALMGDPELEFYFVSKLSLVVSTTSTTTTRHRGERGSKGRVLSSVTTSGPPVVICYFDDYEYIVCSDRPV